MEEITSGTPATITMNFYDETVSPHVLADPSAAKLGIQVGYGTTPTLVDITSFNHVATGIFVYTYDTTGLAVFGGDEVEVQLQVQSTVGIKCISDPVAFTVTPPAIAGLT